MPYSDDPLVSVRARRLPSRRTATPESQSSLRAKGRPIPTNDIWIAAHAMETGADLVSADRHFEHVDGIAWIRLSAS